jgi:hypothetical protein
MPATVSTAIEIDKPARRRRWIPLSLRMFGAVLAFVGVGNLLWFGFSIWLPYHREQEVIQKIEGWGGHASVTTGAPAWLRRVVGDNRLDEVKVFQRAYAVDLRYSTVSDADVLCLGRLASLKHLILAHTAVTDSGLAHLHGLTNLRVLELWDTRVTGPGLSHLGELANLKILNLGNTAVTDAGLDRLSKLTELRSLTLDDTAITDLGLSQLSGLKNLEIVDLFGTEVTEKGLEELRTALPNCRIRHE